MTTNEQPLRDGFRRGRSGAIVALPHMGNWDLAGAWACLTGMPVTTVAERLRPESLYDRFVAYRETARDGGHPAHRRRQPTRRCSGRA